MLHKQVICLKSQINSFYTVHAYIALNRILVHNCSVLVRTKREEIHINIFNVGGLITGTN